MATLKHPKTVQVGSIIYKVTSKKSDWVLRENRNHRSGDYGSMEGMLTTIFLNPDQTPDQMRQTFWHEVLHALTETVMGSPSWENIGENSSEREETIVRVFESPTLLVLRDNPELVKYLTA